MRLENAHIKPAFAVAAPGSASEAATAPAPAVWPAVVFLAWDDDDDDDDEEAGGTAPEAAAAAVAVGPAPEAAADAPLVVPAAFGAEAVPSFVAPVVPAAEPSPPAILALTIIDFPLDCLLSEFLRVRMYMPVAAATNNSSATQGGHEVQVQACLVCLWTSALVWLPDISFCATPCFARALVTRGKAQNTQTRKSSRCNAMAAQDVLESCPSPFGNWDHRASGFFASPCLSENDG